MDTLAGHLLIAPPYLSDPNFVHTVVLMIQHDTEGAFGVVLNRPTGRSIQEVWTEVRGQACDCRQEVHVGGPVTGPLVTLHTEPRLAEMRIVDGVYCSMSADKIEELVSTDRKLVRFYAGYSGWGGGQLEGELATGSWLTTLADEDAIFHTSDDELWSKVVRRASGTETLPGLDLDLDTDDPSLN
ncbi:MAG: YqgE/AlgH family protein [Planctomycetota bacterium]|nr:YqgE/AlgH family protein [Planctomycetota bacterium]